MLRTFGVAVIGLGVLLPAGAAGATRPRPVLFEPNVGQAGPDVRFVARLPGYTALLAPDHVVYALHAPLPSRRPGERTADPGDRPASPGAVLRARLVGARADAEMVGLEEHAARVHYLRGADPAGWHQHVPTFARVRGRDVYPGIDLVYHVTGRHLEYDFLVAPGADPDAIRLAFDGARPHLEADGALVLATAAGALRVRAPVSYQTLEGARMPVPSRFALAGDDAGLVRIEVGAYDRTRPLVIDPMNYLVILGGTADDVGHAIAAGGDLSVYVTGVTRSTKLATTGALDETLGGKSDAFVLKLDVAGDLVFATYLGGSLDDEGQAIAVDGSGSVYVTGSTFSDDFPTKCVAVLVPTCTRLQGKRAGGRDAFVTKLSSTGALLYSTYLGGSGSDAGLGIAVDGNARAHVTGSTRSVDFPVAGVNANTLAGSADAFVARVDAFGTALLMSRYLGGAADDEGQALALDTSNSVYVTGSTASSNFPVVGAVQGARGGGLDAFVTKLTSAGALVYSTYLGGSGDDAGYGIALDPDRNAYVTGVTRSANFPVAPCVTFPSKGGGFVVCSTAQEILRGTSDAFVTKLSPAGSSLVYSTYLGGKADEAGLAIVAVGSDPTVAHVTGYTSSPDFPNTASATTQRIHGGGLDAFAAIVAADGASFGSTTYLGGPGDDAGQGIAQLTSRTWVLGFTTAGSQEDVFVASFVGASFQAEVGLSPTGVTAGAGQFVLQVTGLNITEGATIRWNGSPRATTFAGGSFGIGSVEAAISAADLAAAGSTASITVTSPLGGLLAFGVGSAATLGIYALAPDTILAGSAGAVLTITGGLFSDGTLLQPGGQAAPESVVLWNGQELVTTVLDVFTIQAQVPAGLLASAGVATVKVQNVFGGVGHCPTQLRPTCPASPDLPVTVASANPAPVLTAVIPASAPAGAGPLALVAEGSGFVGSSTVRWNGGALPTVFVHGGRLEATVPAANLVAAGSAQVTVVNPAPGGGTSTALTFTITATNPVPVVSSLAPTGVVAGSGPFTLTVNGSSFAPTSVVRWNGTTAGADRPTTFVSAGQLQASIAGADVAAAGAVPVRVFTPTPGGGTSNAVTFTIAPPPTHALSVTLRGGGGGSVVSSPAGIACPGTCTAAFPAGSGVTLTATAAGGATFTGWDGACVGTSACALTMSGPRDVAATLAPVFSPTTLVSGATVIAAAHVSQLRAAVDTLRSRCACGLGAVAWTDGVLTPGITPVRAIHVLELRAALAAAYAGAGRASPAYTDPAFAAGTPVRAVHLAEIRAAVLNLD